MPGGTAELPLRVLIDGDAVRRRIAQLAAAVAADHVDGRPVAIGILNGAVPFMMELLAALPSRLAERVQYDFVDATSYRGTSSGRVEVRVAPVVDVAGRDVLLVDSIIDTGRTVRAVLRDLEGRQPRRVRVCALLDKAARREVEVPIHYRGFTIDDLFVVGYGMDLDQQYRGLRHIAVYESADAGSGVAGA